MVQEVYQEIHLTEQVDIWYFWYYFTLIAELFAKAL